MTLQQALNSDLRFKHKNWCKTCWKSPVGEYIMPYISDSSMTADELFSNDWVVENWVNGEQVIVLDVKELE